MRCGHAPIGPPIPWQEQRAGRVDLGGRKVRSVDDAKRSGLNETAHMHETTG